MASIPSSAVAERSRVRTEKEAVNKALEMVIIDNQIIETHESVGGKGELIEDIFK